MDTWRKISQLQFVGDLTLFFWFFFGFFTDDKAGWLLRRKTINEFGSRFSDWFRQKKRIAWPTICTQGFFIPSLIKGLPRLAGFGLKAPGDAAKPVIRETATLFSIVITAGALLLIGQIDTNRPIYPFIVAFSLICLAALAGMVVILMAKTNEGRHLYDWASIRFTQVAFAVSLLLGGLLVGFAIAGRLPWQSFSVETKAELGEPHRYTYKVDKTTGVIVPAKLNPKLYPKGIPPKLLMSVTLRDDISQHWKVVKVDGSWGAPEKHPMDPPPVPYTVKEGPPNQGVWYLNGLKEDKSYTLRIFIHEKDREANVSALLKSLQDKGMTVTFHSKEK
jgi:hypothetical protein